MIDVQMHKFMDVASYPVYNEDEIVNSNTDPSSPDFLLLMPHKIFGFSMQSKKWGKPKSLHKLDLLQLPNFK